MIVEIIDEHYMYTPLLFIPHGHLVFIVRGTRVYTINECLMFRILVLAHYCKQYSTKCYSVCLAIINNNI